MGGSYGGYMANWVAGHTDRYRAHRHPRQPLGAARLPRHDRHGRLLGARRWATRTASPSGTPASRPSSTSARIRTPMLVIHGEQDFRVPVSEALRLWTDLRRHGRRRQVPLLPGREPLDPEAPERAALVRHRPRLPRRAPPRAGRSSAPRCCRRGAAGRGRRSARQPRGERRPEARVDARRVGGLPGLDRGRASRRRSRSRRCRRGASASRTGRSRSRACSRRGAGRPARRGRPSGGRPGSPRRGRRAGRASPGRRRSAGRRS